MKILALSRLGTPFFILLFALFSAPQFALALPSLVLRASAPQDDCVNAFLASSGSSPSSGDFLSTTTLIESHLADLAPNAQAYLRFLWAGYKNQFIDINQFKNLAISTVPTNPFRESSEKSFEAGLQRAIAEKIANLTTQDWSAIQIELQNILPRLENEKQDRDEAQEDSSWVMRLFDPQDIGSPFIVSSGSWYEHQGRVFYAANSSTRDLHIFELDLSTGLLIERANAGKVKLGTAMPAWHAHGNRLYLATGSTTNSFYLFELDLNTNKLEETSENRVWGRTLKSASWYVQNRRVYLAVAADSGRLFIFELVAGQLIQLARSERMVSGHVVSQPLWHELSGRLFLVEQCTVGATTSPHELYVFEFAEDNLIERDHKTIGSNYTPASWHEQDGRAYLAVSSRNNHVKLFEFNVDTGLLDEKDDFEATARITTATVWYKFEGSSYLAFGSQEGFLYVLELVAGRFVLRDQYAVKSGFFTWHAYEGRLYLAVATLDHSVYLLEFNSTSEKLFTISSWQANGHLDSTPAFYSNENRLHLALSDWNGRLYHFNILQKIKGRGR